MKSTTYILTIAEVIYLFLAHWSGEYFEYTVIKIHFITIQCSVFARGRDCGLVRFRKRSCLGWKQLEISHNVKYIQRFVAYECYDSTTFCSVTQHEHQLTNMWGERDAEHLVEMSAAGFAEKLNANILFSNWKTSLRVFNGVSVWGFQSGGLSRCSTRLSWRALFSTEMSILTCGADEDS